MTVNVRARSCDHIGHSYVFPVVWGCTRSAHSTQFLSISIVRYSPPHSTAARPKVVRTHKDAVDSSIITMSRHHCDPMIGISNVLYISVYPADYSRPDSHSLSISLLFPNMINLEVKCHRKIQNKQPLQPSLLNHDNTRYLRNDTTWSITCPEPQTIYNWKMDLSAKYSLQCERGRVNEPLSLERRFVSIKQGCNDKF